MMLVILGCSSKIMVPEHDNHAKENKLFDAKPNVDTTHDQLVQMVAGLSLQNEYSRSQLEGLRDVLLESDGFSLFGSKVPKKETEETAQCHLLLEITRWFHAHSTDQSWVIMRLKECKIASSDLLPWYKGVTQCFQRFQTMKIAETSTGFTNISPLPRAHVCMAMRPP